MTFEEHFLKLANSFNYNEADINSKKIVIYGAGGKGKIFGENCSRFEVDVAFYIDSDSHKWDSKLLDLEIKSPKTIYEDKESYIVFICSDFYEEIIRELQNNSFYNWYLPYDNVLSIFEESYTEILNFNKIFSGNKSKFKEVYNLLEDEESKQILISILLYRLKGDYNIISTSEYEQYNHPIARPLRGDVIIDGGAFIGDTVEFFNKLLLADCELHSFEPSIVNYNELTKFVGNNKFNNVYINRLGLDKEKKLFI